MTADKKTFADLKSTVAEKEISKGTEAKKGSSSVGGSTTPAVPKLDSKGRAYGTGRRKSSIARVWVSRGSGKIIVNGRDITDYFVRGTQRLIIAQAFEVANRVGQFDVMCTVSGGGLSGQAGAVRHGISRALINFEPALRAVLKTAGFLTRDARKVERKKYGQHKARKSTQWVKR